MALERRLAQELIRSHPDRAAAVLERFDASQVSRILRGVAPVEAAAVIRRLSPQVAAAALRATSPEGVASFFDALPLGVASRLARRLPAEHLTAVLEEVEPRVARGIRSMVRFPENSAGSLMDPNVLSLREDLTAKEALGRVRESPAEARYNVYIVDQDQKLVGVANLRELFLARPRTCLSDLMVRQPQSIDAYADRSTVIDHPGWKEVHSLPVVDDEGCYLGAIRYRTLRELEELLLRHKRDDENEPDRLGELLPSDAAGPLDAASTPGRTEEGSL